nr:ribonuclease H-like domain-containing protein [Tanacetum cinerariifolium]
MAAYLLNILPFTAIQNEIPLTRLFKTKPVEALHMAAYLLNILPSTAIQNEIPHTRLFKTKPNYADLRVFDKIILSRHVTFDETVFPYGSMTPNNSPSYTFLDTSSNLIQQHLLTNSTKILNLPSTAHRHPTSPTTNFQPNTSPARPHNSPSTPPIQQPAQHSLIQQQAQPLTPLVQQQAPTHTIASTVNPNPTSTHPVVTRFCVGTNRPTKRYACHVSHISPLSKSYTHAFNDPYWYRAMLDEYNALIKNKTWILVPRLHNVSIVRCLWLFWHKHNADGSLNRYKSCLVANGIDVDETFSPVVKPATIRTKYATEVLECDGMLTCNPCRTPVDTDSKLSADGDPVSDPTLYRSLAGALQYLTSTRPDISYTVQQVKV